MQIKDIDLQRMLLNIPIAQLYGPVCGQVLYVNSTGGTSTNLGRSPNEPINTIANALALCNGSQNEVIVCAASHAETLSTTTAGVAVSKSGVTIHGCGPARTRPTLTCGAADISGVSISGNSNRLHNFRLIGSTSQTGAASACLAISGTDNKISTCVFEHGGAGPLQAVSLAAAHRTVFEDCEWIGTSAGPDMGIKTTAVVSNDVRIRRCVFNYAQYNVDSAAIGGLASGGFPGCIMEDIVILGANSSAIRNLGSYAATVSDGLIARVYVGSNTGITAGAAMPFDLGGAQLANCFWTDAVAASSMWLGVAIRVTGGGVVTATGYPYASPS